MTRPCTGAFGYVLYARSPNGVQSIIISNLPAGSALSAIVKCAVVLNLAATVSALPALLA